MNNAGARSKKQKHLRTRQLHSLEHQAKMSASNTAAKNRRPRSRAQAPAQAPASEETSLRRQNFVETEDAYTMEVAVPGFTKADLRVQVLVHQRMLLLNGERAALNSSDMQLRTHISRRWRLPMTANTEAAAVTATLADGILHISFKKCDAVKNVVDIQIA